MQDKYTVSIDLLADYLEIIKPTLIKLKYKIKDDDDALIKYHEYQKRFILTKPRIIKKSAGFSCPTALQAGLSIIEQKIQNGENLTPHLSTGIYNLKKSDGMLLHWDIYHLHLGTILKKNGFMARTGRLLYVRFIQDTAYFINVYDHSSWSKQELIKVLHDNWPESIQHAFYKGAIGLETKFTDEEVAMLRKHQINSAIEVAPNVVYGSPGYGVAASGDSAEAVERSIDLRDKIDGMETTIHNSIDAILEKAFPGNSFMPNLRFRLTTKDSQFIIREMTNNLCIDFNTGQFIK